MIQFTRSGNLSESSSRNAEDIAVALIQAHQEYIGRKPNPTRARVLKSSYEELKSMNGLKHLPSKVKTWLNKL
ncbi:hypothetical protein SP15_296 [Bacillus phage SP-15]|uniref:Uncharacterized protein n=1 Tax=Bacillus phage SP-15 TaxID=1792032 RepID=A0A127AY39_9CAUD|nr:hypothetical protein SP15_296 [Bacillus phage SP-15]AMM45104.1 hypothetical protein SP15_296 [Bacillus phage SP-15]